MSLTFVNEWDSKDNGGMKMINFTGLPKLRESNLPVIQDEEDSGPNFFQHIPEKYIPDGAIVQHSLLRGSQLVIQILGFSKAEFTCP